MSTSSDTEDATKQLPSSVAGKSAEQIEGILDLIDSGDLHATKAQRAYLAGAAFALRQDRPQD